jgi:murein L,D-transpeptidase YafK
MSKKRARFFGLAIGILCLIGIGVAYYATRAGDDVAIGGPADRVVVDKTAHTLTLFRAGSVLKIYRVALGRGGPGQKLKAGDNKVPESVYQIVGRNAHSAFHRALKVGYPTPLQVEQARARGVDPGGDIMIHGIRKGLGWVGALHRQVDWTKGCIAVTNSEIEEIWRLVPDGTPIEIDP